MREASLSVLVLFTFDVCPIPLSCIKPTYFTFLFQLCPYPSDDELQQGLQVSVDWNDYRQNELTATIGVVKGKRIMRDIVLRGSAVQDTC